MLIERMKENQEDKDLHESISLKILNLYLS